MTLDRASFDRNVPVASMQALIRSCARLGRRPGSIVPVPTPTASTNCATVLTSQQVAQLPSNPTPGPAVPSWWSTLALKRDPARTVRRKCNITVLLTRRRSIRS